MIRTFHVENFKALRDVSIELSPLHVLIGPNSSGKTSVLDAISAFARSAAMPLQQAFNTKSNDCSLAWQMERELAVRFVAAVDDGGHSFEYGLAVAFKESPVVLEEWFAIPPNDPLAFPGYGSQSAVCVSTRANLPAPVNNYGPWIQKALDGVQCYRWMPRVLGLPAAPDSSLRFRMHESGFGLVLCLDDILGFDRERFAKLERTFQAIFPEVQTIRLVSEPGFRSTVQTSAIPSLSPMDGKGIHFAFKSGLQLPASQVSDGMLLVLAYLSLLENPESPRILLIEEPENGVHPSRLRDVLRILRDLIQGQEHTQVILTTHSPYVLDMFEPNEVTLCRQSDDGSVITRRLSDSPLVDKQRKVFTLGEIWIAEGDDALIQGGPTESETP